MLSIARLVSAIVPVLPAAAHAPQDGRNYNTLTVVSGIFDRNGNDAPFEFRLKGDTPENPMGQGVTVGSGVEVKPETYAVRLDAVRPTGRGDSVRETI